MEKLHHPLGRGISYLLIYLTAIQPLHPAFAAGINPANTTTQVQAGNVPVINIATPNSAGISHNTYKDFNVGAPGAVLNNSTVAGKSQLAGQVNANTNLKGNAANLIINEVTGGTRSELNGKLEVFGAKANVMIANPNGITCDGCGFINTPGVTLATGKPQFDKQGALDALEVKKGSIIIGSKGLDASAQDYVDIISRATELNGKITAQNLSLTQGANRASYKDGTLTAIAGEGVQPQLAVDTKALGGMYANKIRLVANEEGVGVNLANLTSTQQGITLDTKGKIQLGNTAAKTDLNITAKQADIIKGATVKSERDITVASTTLNNAGTLSAGQDMRLFNDNLTNTQATIQANNNLWIQKDAVGNKGVKVENRSGTIKTTTGDLVIRTERLENVRDSMKLKENRVLPESSSINNYIITIEEIFFVPYPDELFYAVDAVLDDSVPKKWFGHLDMSSAHEMNSGRVVSDMSRFSPESLIYSGRNNYINATALINKSSSIVSNMELFLTGDDFINQSAVATTRNEFVLLSSQGDMLDPVKAKKYFDGKMLYYFKEDKRGKDRDYQGIFKEKYISTGQTDVVTIDDLSPDKITATGNIVADFKNTISFVLDGLYPHQSTRATGEIISSTINPDILSARNITLHANNISSSGNIKADGDITLIAEGNINLNQSALNAANAVSLVADSNIGVWQSSVGGKDVIVSARTGEVTFQTSTGPQFFNADGSRQLGALSAIGDLTLTAGTSVFLRDTVLNQSRNISMTAGKDIVVENGDVLLSYKRLGRAIPAEQMLAQFNQQLTAVGRFNATDSITLNAGGTVSLPGVSVTAGKDIVLSAAQSIDLKPRISPVTLAAQFPSSRTPELSSRLSAGNNLSVFSGADISAGATQLTAKGNVVLSAGRNILLPTLAYSIIDNKNDNNKDDHHSVASLHADKALTLAANGELVADGAAFSSGDNMLLSSGGNMAFNAIATHIYREERNAYSESVTQKNATLNSGGVLTLLSNGSILFQATQLIAKGALDAAAKGGFLYAQAMEESSHYEKTTTKRKWYGKKTTIRQVSHNVTNKVTEFTAGGDINLLSRDDSTYEASKINAGKNAKLTSTNGKVNFKAVKNTAFEQTITTSKGFFIKNADKGYTKDTWVLPTVYTGGKLTVDAANGVSADVKAQNVQALQNVLLTLGNTPGTAWLKDLNTRKDVQWTQVQDAYSSWNHKSQSLNPVVGAVIAIAVAAVTAGAGLAAYGADLAAGTLGSTSAAVTAATYGAAYSGITAITSQAAVALLDNQGNISKTLEALSNSNSVKSLVTAMVIGGALSGFDSVMGFDKAAGGTAATNAGNAKLPLLSNGDWSKIAQRVAGQSIISSSLNTTINGGSFKDNFTTALLANIGNQFQAEGAFLIGENGAVLEAPGKMLSHAVVAGVAAEIGGGNVKGAAVGALAAELAAITLGDIFTAPATRDIQIESAGRIIGAITGAAVTGSSSGANSGASAAENTLRYNFLMHDEPAKMAKKLADCKGSGQCEIDVRREISLLSAQNEKRFEICRGAGDGDCINEMLLGISKASGFRELGIQIGFDIAGQYQQMGENAYDRFDTCGWSAGTGCALKLWGKEAAADAAVWGAGWGLGKIVGPALGKYFTEVGILSQRGAFANIKSAQVGLKDPAYVDIIKDKMRNNSFDFSAMENRVGGYVDKSQKYYLQEGNHRMVAAKELYQETGDSKYVENIIKYGRWEYTEKYTGDILPLPVRNK